MKTANRANATHANGHGSVLTRTLACLALLSAAAVFSAGCDGGQEGDRCNPDLSHNDCNAGLTCQQPPECPENYCCPATGTSNNPNCQPGCTPGGVPALCATDPTAAACVMDAEAVTDAGPDAAGMDTGIADTGVSDTGVVDTGTVDTGPKDTGPKDTGPKDTGEDSHG
jgi:hypothetical protein